MRTYLILKEKSGRFKADAEIQGLLAEIHADDGSMDALLSTARLTAGNSPHDDKALRTRDDGIRQRRIWCLVGQVLPTGKEPYHRPPLLGDLIADRAAQRRIASLQRVEDHALRNRTLDVKLYFGADLRQHA